MNTERKKALLVDVCIAIRALGRVRDERHDLSQILTFPMSHAETLRESIQTARIGLVMLCEHLKSEIGTDSLWNLAKLMEKRNAQ
jgi:hypothetical protein